MIWLYMSFHVLVQSHIHVGLTFNNGHSCPKFRMITLKRRIPSYLEFKMHMNGPNPPIDKTSLDDGTPMSIVKGQAYMYMTLY
jgi:hypothetical protein